MWDLIVSVPDHCLYFTFQKCIRKTYLKYNDNLRKLIANARSWFILFILRYFMITYLQSTSYFSIKYIILSFIDRYTIKSTTV